MATWFKDEESGRLLTRRRLDILLTRREFAIVRTYAKNEGRTFEEALLDAVELGIESLAEAGHDPVQPKRTRILALLLTIGVLTGGGFVAVAKTKAPEPLTTAWATRVDTRLSALEDQTDDLESQIDEVTW